MLDPAPTLDLAAIEERADEWILSSVDRRELAYTLINTDVPALVARVRALEAVAEAAVSHLESDGFSTACRLAEAVRAAGYHPEGLLDEP